MRYISVVAAVVSVCSGIVSADIDVSGLAAVELTKKHTDQSSGTMDGSWIRGEVKARATMNGGLSVILHGRAQPNMGDFKGAPLQPRQVYFSQKISSLEIVGGRWYEVYGPGYSYFGRYLYGVDYNAFGLPVGTGNMNTDYTVLDGLKLKADISALRGSFQVALLPQDFGFSTAYLSAMFSGNPVEGLRFSVGGNYEALQSDDGISNHRAAANCGYTLVKEMKLELFGEAAVTDFQDWNDNVWLLVGASVKAGKVLDRVQFEVQITDPGKGDPENDGSIGWMLLFQKKLGSLTFDLNVGADPRTLGSTGPREVGAILRTTAKF